MNSEVVKNFRVAVKDTPRGGKSKVTDKNYIFTCRNCNQEISLPGGKGFVNMEKGSTDNILSLHLMTCEKYLLTPEKGATAI